MLPIGPTDNTSTNNYVNPTSNTNTTPTTTTIPTPTPQQVSKYLNVAYDEPWVSASGNVHESSSIDIPAGTNIVNSRSTREGQKADAAARKGVYQQTGMHPGHDHPTQLGVDPSDTRNIRPQNAVQNGPGGTWYENDKNNKALIKANPDLDYSQTVTRVTRPGEDAPFYRKMVSTFSDGQTFGDNVLYGNFPSPASRTAASNGGLKPGDAGPLDNQFKRDVKAQMKPTPETEAAGNQFERVLAMRQSLSAMTPEQKAAYIGERNKLVVPNQPEPSTDTPPDGGNTPKALTATASGTRRPKAMNDAGSEPSGASEPGGESVKHNRFGPQYQTTSLSVANWNPNMPSGSVASKTFRATAGPASGSVTVSALGYDTTAGASAGLQHNALTAQEQVGADVYLGKVSVAGRVNLPDGASLSGNGSAMAGAGATESGQVAVDPLHGTVDANADVNAFAGGRAQGAMSAGAGPLGATAQGDVGAGIGLDAQANVGIEKGKITFDIGLQAYVGVGGGGNLSFSVDPSQAIKDAGHVASDIGNGISNAWDSATSWL